MMTGSHFTSEVAVSDDTPRLRPVKDYLDFEQLISNISAKLIATAVEDLERTIQSALDDIRIFFRADRCGLLAVSDHSSKLCASYASYSEGTREISSTIDLARMYPWASHQVVIKRETLNIWRPEDLPPDAEVDRVTFATMGTKSLLVIPIEAGHEERLHLMLVSSVTEERTWPPEYVPRLRLLGEMLVNMVERNNQLRFETLLVDISAKFVNLPASRIDDEINNAQVVICEYLGMGHSSIWQVSAEKPGSLRLTHISRDPSLPSPPLDSMGEEYWPWVASKMLNNEILCIPDIKQAPPEAKIDVESWKRFQVRSALIIPLAVGGNRPIGCLAFSDPLLEDRNWPEPLQKRLRLIAQIFASALDRKRTEQKLLESEARLRLAGDSAGVGFWTLNPTHQTLWTTPKLNELFGLEPGEEMDYDRFFHMLHPDDTAIVQKAITDVLSTGIEREVEYRVVRKDGTIRQIVARGNRHPYSGDATYILTGVLIDVTERNESIVELKSLRERLEHENVYLRQEVTRRAGAGSIIGRSDAIRCTLALADQVAQTNSTVLLLGETGCGKGRLASYIHQCSQRRDRPMITVNCSAIPSSLLESELFGREKGAYTGALSKQIGRFELAHRSTLFIDEIGELPLEMQVKLLRVLESQTIERLGNPRSIPIDVRIITATNRDLTAAVADGRFRKDLFYRLNIFPITVPPLRSRSEDIPLFIDAFIDDFEMSMAKPIERVDSDSIEALKAYLWPGNVRELRNVVERAMIMTKGPTLRIALPESNIKPPTGRDLTTLERTHILQVLQDVGWRIRGPHGAAARLGLKPTTLESRIKNLGLVRPGTR